MEKKRNVWVERDESGAVIATSWCETEWATERLDHTHPDLTVFDAKPGPRIVSFGEYLAELLVDKGILTPGEVVALKARAGGPH